MFGDKPPGKTIVYLGDRGSGEAEARQALMFQPCPRLQGVLAQGRVCKPFAHECWLICHERWPKGWLIRTYRWPTHAPVGKPEVYCSQATTAMGRSRLLRWNWGTPMPLDLPW
jgi:hypothetical protein